MPSSLVQRIRIPLRALFNCSTLGAPSYPSIAMEANPANRVTKASPSAFRPDPPLRDTFRRPAFDTHLEYRLRRYRRLDRAFFRTRGFLARRFPADLLQPRLDQASDSLFG